MKRSSVLARLMSLSPLGIPALGGWVKRRGVTRARGRGTRYRPGRPHARGIGRAEVPRGCTVLSVPRGVSVAGTLLLGPSLCLFYGRATERAGTPVSSPVARNGEMTRTPCRAGVAGRGPIGGLVPFGEGGRSRAGLASFGASAPAALEGSALCGPWDINPQIACHPASR